MSKHRRASLFETAHGHVRTCACCPALEVRFGNALLALGPDDLPHVLDQLEAAESHECDVTLLMGETGSGWVFTADEAAELHRLVAGARLMLDVAA
ncbi:hypothetical protein [Roseisolibacter sp. H3M3-2]|uniref:hypothetical protein n=1 Tax=Roseisolibacter sp. H3M3-2 TaxID=3031323 RepID=UPI0023DB9737|nr:hypothetical protein [Roseisolibacter sp. H3M3-2]MDF1503741.1 hypothetical protein [Roseisolibacter sp. H3M3-2]